MNDDTFCLRVPLRDKAGVNSGLPAAFAGGRFARSSLRSWLAARKGVEA